MSKIRLFLAATLVALGAAAHAADTTADATATAQGKPTLATDANRQLRQNDVPSVKTDPQGAESIKAKADADIASRNARDTGRRLQVRRQNLKGPAAAREIAQQTNPNTIDHDTAYGDKDHTQQVTNLKVQIKK
jgi:hypothetical protein